MVPPVAQLRLDALHQLPDLLRRPVQYAAEGRQREGFQRFEAVEQCQVAHFFQSAVFGPGADGDLGVRVRKLRLRCFRSGTGTYLINVISDIDKAELL